jgi:hypothetical protein
MKIAPSPKQSVRSFRGKIVDEDLSSSETGDYEDSYGNKNDILDSYINE